MAHLRAAEWINLMTFSGFLVLACRLRLDSLYPPADVLLAGRAVRHPHRYRVRGAPGALGPRSGWSAARMVRRRG